MRSVATPSLLYATLCASGCLRVIDLDDDGNDVDAIVVSGDAATGDAVPFPDGAWDQDCSIPLPCPAPNANRVAVCGWIHDAESDGVVAAANPTRQSCTGLTDTGPCSLRVRYFDALDFAGNPSSAQPITPESSMVDDCGRFRATNMPRPTFGFLGIAVDDTPGITPVTPHRPTVVNVPNSLATPGILRIYSTRVSTDMMWSTSAGLANQTFAQRGVLMKVFTVRGQPVAGVSVRRSGSLIPNDDYYFSDTTITRTTIDPQRTSTGPSGAVLVINADTPIAHDGVGSEPAGCRWPSNLGASTPGVVSIDIVEAEMPSGVICP
ncbi:MAG TPA: hypothetical protein VM261_18530 [Kofleriaceae bacterium]|nr:hypothetical protein [Kofleriaceae bacterium]